MHAGGPMATAASPRSRTFVGSFYITMAAIFAFVAFSGFFLTYWMPVARGTFSGSPMLHMHGLLFSLWTLFFLSQAILVANGGLRHHKAWGLAGISLATAMVLVGITVAVHGLGRRLEFGYGDAARAFAFVPVSAALLFGGLVAAAIANWRNPEWHKRLMLVATGALLQPAIARYFFPQWQGRCGSQAGRASTADRIHDDAGTDRRRPHPCCRPLRLEGSRAPPSGLCVGLRCSPCGPSVAAVHCPD